MNFEYFKKINDEKLNYGEMEEPTVISSYRNVGCGDGYRIYLKIDNNIVKDASYTTTGCGFGLAALAMATEWVKNKSVGDVENISSADIETLFEFPPLRKNYPDSAVEAMQKAINDYKNGTGINIDTHLTKNKILDLLKKEGHLKNLVLKQAVLEQENLSGIDLSNTDLSNAFLQGANLEGANLEGVNLRGAFLNQCNLKNANLKNADLRWCKLSGANLEGTIFTDALYDIGTRVDSKYIPIFKHMKQAGKESYAKVD